LIRLATRNRSKPSVAHLGSGYLVREQGFERRGQTIQRIYLERVDQYGVLSKLVYDTFLDISGKSETKQNS
jgi:hypothetical protein